MASSTMPTVEPTAARSARDPWLDNAKAGLVLLVVVGHMWALLPADSVGGQLYDFLYLWHMPAFVLVSGYLSRSFLWRRDRMWQVVRTLLVPYLVFETALAAFRIGVGGEDLDDLFADPHFPLWYLVALAAWRLLTPLLRPLGGLALVVALGASLSGGFIDGEPSRWLDIARILGFLPFFVIGMLATPERLEWLRGRFPAVLGAATFALLAMVALNLDRWAGRAELYYRPYDLTELSATDAVLTRLLLLVVGTAGALAWLALVPRVGGWFTRIGAATMTIYLCHGFVVKGAEFAGFQEWAHGASAPAGLLAASAIGVATTLLLAARPSRRALEPVIDPVGHAEDRLREAVRLTKVVRAQEYDAPSAVDQTAAHQGVTSGR